MSRNLRAGLIIKIISVLSFLTAFSGVCPFSSEKLRYFNLIPYIDIRVN